MSYSEQNSAIDTFVTCWEESARLKGWETGNVKALSYLVDGNANGFTRTNDIREIVKGIDRVQLLKETYGRMLSVTADRARRNVKLTSNKFLFFEHSIEQIILSFNKQFIPGFNDSI